MRRLLGRVLRTWPDHASYRPAAAALSCSHVRPACWVARILARLSGPLTRAPRLLGRLCRRCAPCCAGRCRPRAGPTGCRPRLGCSRRTRSEPAWAVLPLDLAERAAGQFSCRRPPFSF